MINTKILLTSVLIIVPILIGLYLIKYFDIYYPVKLVITTRSTEFSVVGEGKVDVVPDTAYVDAGISVNNMKTVDEAERQINQVNNKIIDSMRKLGIEKKDIKTSNYSINPNYKYDNGQSNISGYSGNATLVIKVRDITIISKVITEAADAGANQISGARFAVDKPEVYREKARGLAISNAKNQAERLAKQTGIKLGKVVNIVESTPSKVYPVYKTMEVQTEAPDIEQGSQTVSSTVTLYFEKK